MDYREIVAVTGIGGLYQLVTSKGDGAIVRSLADGKTVFVSARKHHVTPIESIEIYTTGDNVRLHEVLQMMKEAEAETPLPETKDPKVVAAYFSTIFPEYDRERVYPSDLKKLVKWYSLLKSADLLDFSRYQQEQEEGAEGDDAMANEQMPLEGKAQVAEHNKDHHLDDEAASQSIEGGDLDLKETPAKKARAAKATAEGEEAPKKTSRKKAAEPTAEGEGEEAPKKTARKKKTDEA